MQKDSFTGTLVVAGLICIVCSFFVSGAAITLKDKQEENKVLDIKKNLLLASGLAKDSKITEEEIEIAFQNIQAQVIDLETGDVLEDIAPESFNQRKAAKDQTMNKTISAEDDVAGIKQRSKYAKIYKVIDTDQQTTQMYIFPIHGKGLWSTLYGFLALDNDLQTVKGIGFYEHAETPGLGGEVDNPQWKATWQGKKIYDEDFEVRLHLIKGKVSESDSQNLFKIDGLSGATITSNGVTHLIDYWFGHDGFKPFIAKHLQQEGSLSWKK
ncbi:MAG: Na(+)-translocating NADH-quinone reductase subunit C [Bdellovibrionales bacterium]|nr:Na(+)-translocating NADH-quinone reductase subunit C [Bdellovibrionales bacterium]